MYTLALDPGGTKGDYKAVATFNIAYDTWGNFNQNKSNATLLHC